jgi:hypothetical protein
MFGFHGHEPSVPTVVAAGSGRRSKVLTLKKEGAVLVQIGPEV